MLLAAYIATAKSVHCDAFEITLCLVFCHNVCKQETQCNVCRCNIVPLTEVNLNDIINGMESEQTTLRYSLGEGLKGRKDSVSVRRYIAHMKSEGSFGEVGLHRGCWRREESLSARQAVQDSAHFTPSLWSGTPSESASSIARAQFLKAVCAIC